MVTETVTIRNNPEQWFVDDEDEKVLLNTEDFHVHGLRAVAR